MHIACRSQSPWGPLVGPGPLFEKHWNSSWFTEGLSSLWSDCPIIFNPTAGAGVINVLCGCNGGAFITVIIQEDNKNVSASFCSKQMLSNLRCPSEDVWCFTSACSLFCDTADRPPFVMIPSLLLSYIKHWISTEPRKTRWNELMSWDWIHSSWSWYLVSFFICGTP